MRKEKKFNHKYGDYFQRGQNEIYLHTALREMNREASTEVKGGATESRDFMLWRAERVFIQTNFFLLPSDSISVPATRCEASKDGCS